LSTYACQGALSLGQQAGSQYRPDLDDRLSGHQSIFLMGNPSLPRCFPVRAQTREELEELAGRCRPHGRIGG
jgi:hypothetical protein